MRKGNTNHSFDPESAKLCSSLAVSCEQSELDFLEDDLSEFFSLKKCSLRKKVQIKKCKMIEITFLTMRLFDTT